MEAIEVELCWSSVTQWIVNQWVVDLYNYLILGKGQAIISNGWKVAAVTDAISKGSTEVENI